MRKLTFTFLLAMASLNAPSYGAIQLDGSSPPAIEETATQAHPELPGEAPLIERAELDSRATSQPDSQVTVLVSLERADAVSASTSVDRTFDRASGLKLQSVGSSNAIFVSGAANFVLEATRRLEALDAATPERRVIRRKASEPDDLPSGTEEQLSSVANGIGFLIIGTIGLIFAALLALRRWAS